MKTSKKYFKKYLKTKIKSDQGRINTNFHNINIPKEGSQQFSLSVILIDTIFRTDKSYYPQAFLKEFKYFAKEKKMPVYITDKISSDDSVTEDSDEENSNEENSDGDNFNEQNEV